MDDLRIASPEMAKNHSKLGFRTHVAIRNGQSQLLDWLFCRYRLAAAGRCRRWRRHRRTTLHTCTVRITLCLDAIIVRTIAAITSTDPLPRIRKSGGTPIFPATSSISSCVSEQRLAFASAVNIAVWNRHPVSLIHQVNEEHDVRRQAFDFRASPHGRRGAYRRSL